MENQLLPGIKPESLQSPATRIKELKSEMEMEINLVIKEFQERTGASVASIELLEFEREITPQVSCVVTV